MLIIALKRDARKTGASKFSCARFSNIETLTGIRAMENGWAPPARHRLCAPPGGAHTSRAAKPHDVLRLSKAALSWGGAAYFATAMLGAVGQPQSLILLQETFGAQRSQTLAQPSMQEARARATNAYSRNERKDVSRHERARREGRQWNIEGEGIGIRMGEPPERRTAPNHGLAAIHGMAASISASLLSALFRSIGRLAAWLGSPERAAYWSLKALDLSMPEHIGERYLTAMSQHYRIPLPLARKVIWIESRARHVEANGRIVTSPKGALGIMQLMPATARALNVDPLDMRDNIRGGFAYLAHLSNKYGGDWDKTVAAYNWGPGNVDSAVARYGKDWRRALPRESANYLWRLRTGSTLYKL